MGRRDRAVASGAMNPRPRTPTFFPDQVEPEPDPKSALERLESQIRSFGERVTITLSFEDACLVAECAKRGLYKGRGRKGIRSSEGDKLRWRAIIHFARCSRPSRTTRPARSNPASARRVLIHAPQQTTHGLHGVTQSPRRQAA